jgi:hypothetical protein
MRNPSPSFAAGYGGHARRARGSFIELIKKL